ncbi:hypothetical protein PIB30_102155, partial [Stylosanthes scabra]|nr:hypothetical protein [Stylosanthes scabra]
ECIINNNNNKHEDEQENEEKQFARGPSARSFSEDDTYGRHTENDSSWSVQLLVAVDGVGFEFGVSICTTRTRRRNAAVTLAAMVGIEVDEAKGNGRAGSALRRWGC